MAREMWALSPLLGIVATMLGIVLCPILIGRAPRTLGAVAAVGVALTLFLSIRVFGGIDGGSSGLMPASPAGMLIVDRLSVGFQIILAIFLAGVMWLWWIGSSATEENAPEFFVLLLGSALGMMLMVGTSHLLMIVIAIETASLPSYAMVGFDKRDRVGAEASLKYVVFGAVCSAIMLYGVSLLYGLTGSMSVTGVAEFAVENLGSGPHRFLLITALMCFLAGIAFKISAVPFHFWCPDAFQGAKIEVTTWLSVASKAAGLILLARLVSVFCGSIDQPLSMSVLAPAAWTIAIISAITCTVGNFSAYMQQSVKRLLAYSSIAHAGYMMMAAAVFLHPANAEYASSITALIVYVVVYLFMNLGAFGVTALVIWETGDDKIESFTGLMRRAPWLAIPMIVCLMSLVGLPPFAGFLGKWWVLLALGGTNTTVGWFLVIVAVFNTLISLYFYLRVVVQMVFKDDGRPVMPVPAAGLALVNLCAVALLVLFVFAQPLKESARAVAEGVYSVSSSENRAVASTSDYKP